jgi:crotonobetainyl-CoA:carnitine CoA-transferase CaiB-like acyl-CoA transferase
MGQFPTPRTPGIPLEVDAALPPAPRIGEHGAAILAEIGLDPVAITRLGSENIVFLPEVL